MGKDELLVLFWGFGGGDMGREGTDGRQLVWRGF